VNQGVARATIEPRQVADPDRLVWQPARVAWIGGGVALIARPWMARNRRGTRIVVTLADCVAFVALANAWATAGPGIRAWVALSARGRAGVAGY